MHVLLERNVTAKFASAEELTMMIARADLAMGKLVTSSSERQEKAYLGLGIRLGIARPLQGGTN